MKGVKCLSGPYAIIIIGLPGCGKTTLAQLLIENKECFYCSSDVIRSKIFDEFEIKKDRDYSKFELDVIYNIMLYITEIQLQNNVNILLDGVFRDKKMRENICNIIRNKGYKLYKFYVTCSDEVALSRVESRKKKGTLSPAGIEGYWGIKEKFDIPLADEKFVEIDNSLDKQYGINRMLEKIKI